MQTTIVDPEYAAWAESIDSPSAADIGRRRAEATNFRLQPRISILMPAVDPDPALLDAAIRSIRGQAYSSWELCIADDASTHPAVAAVLRSHAGADPRTKPFFRHRRGGLAAAANTAWKMSGGAYVALVGQHDLLPPLALHWIAETINRHPHAQVLYSDEDKVDAWGRRFGPHFKCDFNHVLLLAQDMISRLGVYRRELVEEVGGFRAGFEAAQDHDLALRCVAAVPRPAIVHIPRILYHRRAPAADTTSVTTTPPVADPATVRAVTEHVRRFDAGACVEPAPESPHHLRIRHSLPAPPPLTSIIICTRDHEALLRTAIDSILAKTTYPNYEIIVVDNGSRDEATLRYLSSLAARPGIRVIRDDSPFNFSRLNNSAARHARGPVLCLLNDDIEVLTPDWLEEMVSFAVQPGVGAVGARLWYPDGTLQHGGILIGVGGVAGHAHHRLGRGQPGYFGRAVLQQELSAVTGACLTIRRDVFDEVGGFDERIAVAFNDVDLCLRIRAAGYRNVWTPFAELIHHESASRGRDDNPENLARLREEARWMEDRWGATLDGDPAYSPHFSPRTGLFTFEALPPWRLAATDRSLSTAVGRMAGGSVVSDGRAGHLLFGPYRRMTAGRWTAAVEGLLEPGAGCLRIDVASHTGQQVHAALELTKATDRATLEFDLHRPVLDLEIRVWVHERATARIDAIAVEAARTDIPRAGDDAHGFPESRVEAIREAMAPADPPGSQAETPGDEPASRLNRGHGATARGFDPLGVAPGGVETACLRGSLGDAPRVPDRRQADNAAARGGSRAHDARDAHPAGLEERAA